MHISAFTFHNRERCPRRIIQWVTNASSSFPVTPEPNKLQAIFRLVYRAPGCQWYASQGSVLHLNLWMSHKRRCVPTILMYGIVSTFVNYISVFTTRIHLVINNIFGPIVFTYCVIFVPFACLPDDVAPT